MTYQLGSSPNEQAKGIAEWRAWWQARRGDTATR
jgi:hypothetical protein